MRIFPCGLMDFIIRKTFEVDCEHKPDMCYNLGMACIINFSFVCIYNFTI